MKKTSQKSTILLIIVTIFLLTANIYAAPTIRNTELSNTVAQAELLFANQEFLDAARAYLTAINLTNAVAQEELAEVKFPDVCPYVLRLHFERLESLTGAQEHSSEAFGVECRAILDKYKSLAEGKSWILFNQLYGHLVNHYRITYNSEMLLKTLEEAANFDPLSHIRCEYINYLIASSTKPMDAATVSGINKLIDEHKEAYGKLSSGIALCKLRLVEATGGDVFNEALDYLKIYPDTIFGEIRETILILRNSIDPDKPEQIRSYYQALTVIAVKQPSDAAHFQAIAFILNEKKKLETILPELKE
ncbi:hypothetical protein KAH27_09505 [bacterium]|nr:hypothetical protein [bacterium]